MRRLVAAAGLVVAACAALPPPVQDTRAPPAPASFDIEGRLSARRGADGGAAHFTWQHDAKSDRVELATPLGQTLARLSGTPGAVHAEWPDGRTLDARDWNEMTERALGVAVPVQGLSAWLRGIPAHAAAASIERDPQGRPLVLREDGWEIVYAYAGDTARQPARLTLRYADGEPTEVRLVIDRWQ